MRNKPNKETEMIKKTVTNVFLLTLALTTSLSIRASDKQTAWIKSFPQGLMPITKRMAADYKESLATSKRMSAKDFPRRATLPAEVNLLPEFDYIPENRDQGNCASCWLWASTGCSAIELSVNKNIKDNFSVQFGLSYLPFISDKNGCSGGTAKTFENYCDRIGYFIPTSNENASFVSNPFSSILYPYMINTDNRYYFNSVTRQLLNLGDDQQSAIEILKTALANNHPIFFGTFMGAAGWTALYEYWVNGDSTPWNYTSSDGQSYNNNVLATGGHAMILVGYSDPDENGAGYWTVLNSWATADGKRPEGTFKLAMDINYQAKCYFDEDNPVANTNSLSFYTYDIDWTDDVSTPESDSKPLRCSSSFNEKSGVITVKTSNAAWVLEDEMPDHAKVYINSYPQTIITCDLENGVWEKNRNGYTYKSSKRSKPSIHFSVEQRTGNPVTWTLNLKDSQMRNYLNVFNGIGVQLFMWDDEGTDFTTYSSPYLVYEDIQNTTLRLRQR